MVNLNVLLLTAVLSAPGEAVLVQFTAQGCAPCQQMAPTMQRLEEAGYPIRQVDVDRHPQIARDWRVDAVPCFVLVRDNREIDRIVGPASHDRLVQLFQRAGSVASRSSEARQAPIIRGQSPDDERELADPYAVRSATAEAVGTSSRATGPLSPEQIGLSASVRIKVNDRGGTSFGTGTIIDTHQDEALVVTCGHLFRDSQGQGEIHVELLAPSAAGRVVRGQVIDWDADDRDIALLVIRPGIPVTTARVASSLNGIQRGAPVFSVGCNHGGAPTIMRSTVAAIDRYTNAPNIVVAGQPVDGRSGGGLFTQSGELIGICNAADPTDDEGIYAGLRTIHEQLDMIGMSRIYQEAPTSLAGAPSDFRSPPTDPRSVRPATTSPGSVSLDREVAAMDRRRDPDATRSLADERFADNAIPGERAVALSDVVSALENGQEVICIIRAPNQKEARVVFLDDDARKLLSRLSPKPDANSPPRPLDEQTASRPVPTQWRK